MKRTIIIEDDPKTGHVAITVLGEERVANTKAQRAFDLILPALKDHFQPVRTWFRPVKAERKRS